MFLKVRDLEHHKRKMIEHFIIDLIAMTYLFVFELLREEDLSRNV